MGACFTEASMKFLRGLAKHNDREWFEPRKPIYEAELKAPMLAVIDEITQAMAEFAPEYMRPANKIMMRIYRDTRFSKDKKPYKTQIAAWWSQRGLEKTGGGFYFHVRPEGIVCAAGVYMPEREQLNAVREWMAENHEDYRALVKAATRSKALGLRPIDANLMTRMPKGYAPDHPGDELLRARNWGLSCELPADVALKPSLAREIVKRYRVMTPQLQALNEAIRGQKKGAGMAGWPLF